MMNNRISSRDWERLSAYLDGELSSGKRARLERRLARDADLQRALDDLRQMRQVLRSLPVVRARRNFTLTPDIAAAPRRSLAAVLYPAVSFVAAAASLLFIVLLFRDVTGMRQPMMVAAPPVESLAEEVAPRAEEEMAAPEAALDAAEAPQEKALPAEGESLPVATQAPPALDVSPTAQVVAPVAAPRRVPPLTLISGLVALAAIGTALILRSRR